MGDVRVHDVRAVKQLPQLLAGGRHGGLVDGVGRLCRGEVMGLGAYPADLGRYPRELLDVPAFAELLEAPQLRDLQVRVLHAAVIVEEYLYFPVALEPGYRVDADLFHDYKLS